MRVFFNPNLLKFVILHFILLVSQHAFVLTYLCDIDKLTKVVVIITMINNINASKIYSISYLIFLK